MELLRKFAGFRAPLKDLKIIYFIFVRSQLEQSAAVWHSSLTEENVKDLERVQKSALKIMLRNEYRGYKKSLKKLNMKTLSERREKLCLNFALKCTKNKKMKRMFPQNLKFHTMKTRNPEKFIVEHARTERLKNSSIIYMQNLLNQHCKNFKSNLHQI